MLNQPTVQPTYEEAVTWVAMNDEPTWLDDNKGDIASQISTLLVADMFEIAADKVADDIIIIRKAIAQREARKKAKAS